MARPSDLKIPKRLFTTEEAGIYIAKSQWVVTKMIRDGELRYVPAGRSKLLDVKDLDAWIDRAKVSDAD
jgi:excisionase family DNA binding protein